jgi:hypothetical protein
MNRGAGGTGVWDGSHLAVSKNWRTWKILANGPIRGVFELGYEPWDAGGGLMVSEVKRFTVDAGQNLDQIESTFTYTPRAGGDGELIVAVALSQHTTIAKVDVTRDGNARFIALWEQYNDRVDGQLGTGVVLADAARFAGFAELPATPQVPRLIRPELMLLAKVRSGEPLRYLAGGAWDKSGVVKTKEEWDAYLRSAATRLASAVTVSYAD